MTDQQTHSAKLIRKITVKAVVGDLKKFILSGQFKDGNEYPVMRVRASVGRTQTGNGDFGPWIALKGTVQAVNLITGETFDSGKLLLPDFITDMIVSKMNAMEEGEVQFSMDITVKVDHASSTLYEYGVTMHLNEGANPLAYLLEKEPEIELLKLDAPANENKELADKVAARAKEEAEDKAAAEATKAKAKAGGKSKTK